jgi:uncharacterized protein with von Willebrand factor type A (vWA) domain
MASVAVTARLALLVSGMRAAGARVGLAEVLRAHRALASVDPTVRGDSYFALRAALCSKPSDIEAFDAAFEASFGDPPATRSDPETVAHKDPGHDPGGRRARRPPAYARRGPRR